MRTLYAVKAGEGYLRDRGTHADVLDLAHCSVFPTAAAARQVALGFGIEHTELVELKLQERVVAW